MAITNANQMIDITAINEGCTIIENAAQDYLTCAERVLEAASICDGEALSVEKTTMQPTLEDLGEQTKLIPEYICNFTAKIRSESAKIYATQQAQLNEYQAAQAAQENSN